MNTLPALLKLDKLIGRNRWVIIGVSALVFDDYCIYLEITKPKYWRTAQDGRTIITLACIGGRLDLGESSLGCLEREAREEIDVSLDVIDANCTYLLVDDVLQAGCYNDGKAPLPWFYTVRQDKRPGSKIKVAIIITYLAKPLTKPKVGDLHGLMVVPRGKLLTALSKSPVPLKTLCQKFGACIKLDNKLPDGVLVEPILTARSISLLPEELVKRRGL